jgi:hypothetical protein
MLIKNNKKNYDKIPGLWYRDKDNNIKSNIKSKMFDNLDKDLPGQELEFFRYVKIQGS